MVYDLYFHYRIDKEANLGEDENGDPCEVYMRVKFEECNTETRDTELEKQAHNDLINDLAEQLEINPEYIVPITKEEYDENN